MSRAELVHYLCRHQRNFSFSPCQQPRQYLPAATDPPQQFLPSSNPVALAHSPSPR